MRVLLVEPHYDHPFTHLFILKAITHWRGRGAEVSWTKGFGIETEGKSFDLVQITTPIFSWAMGTAIETILYYKQRYPQANFEIGGVLASNHPKLIEEKTGVRPHIGIHKEILNAAPSWDAFPKERLCRVQITVGCGVGCGFCLVPKMYGPRSYEVENWQSHFNDALPIWHVIDDNLSQALTTISGLDDRLLAFCREHPHRFDLNSGIEPRTFTEKVADVLTQLPIWPYRTAFDEVSEEKYVRRTIEALLQRGLSKQKIHVYLLYGYKDSLDDATYRLNVLFEYGVVPFAMRYVPLDWFGPRQGYRPPEWDPLHYIDFARYVNQLKRHSLYSNHRWTFTDYLAHCESHNHYDDPMLAHQERRFEQAMFTTNALEETFGEAV